MRKYIKLAWVSTEQTIAYRSNFLISISVTVLLFMSSFYLWRSIYGDNGSISTYTWEMMRGYLLVSFACNTLLSWFSESAISKRILDGSVALDLVKPLDFSLARFFETLGASIFEILVVICMSIVLIFSLRITLPGRVSTWICFCISMIISLIIKFSIVYIFSLLTFFTTSYRGVAWARAAITNLFSGALIPLSFFPDWFSNVLSHMPFRFIVFIPANIFLNVLNEKEIYHLLAEAVVWIISLILFSRFLFKVCVRKIVINGG